MSAFSISNLESLNYQFSEKKFDSFSTLQNEATKFALSKIKNLTVTISKLSNCTSIIQDGEKKNILAINTPQVKAAVEKAYSSNVKIIYIPPATMPACMLTMYLNYNEQFISQNYENSSKQVKDLYNNIMNGVGFVLFPHSSIADAVKTLSPAEIVEKIAKIEGISADRKTLLVNSLILKNVVLKTAQIYVGIALKHFSNVFSDVSDKNPNWKWTKDKIEALAS